MGKSILEEIQITGVLQEKKLLYYHLQLTNSISKLFKGRIVTTMIFELVHCSYSLLKGKLKKGFSLRLVK